MPSHKRKYVRTIKKHKKHKKHKKKGGGGQNWYKSYHLHKHPSIFLKDLHGYVLPHAGTKHSGNIISHTMRFKPSKKFNRVVILFLPSSKTPNVSYKNQKYYHEYFVPWRSFEYFYGHKNLTYVGINVLEQNSYEKFQEETIYILSADFSHLLPFQEAIELENKAAQSMMFRDFRDTDYNRIIDDKRTFEILNTIIPKHFYLQWVGRTRSTGTEAVGYLSFLIRDTPEPEIRKPNGMFVTLYDKEMNTRECLGEWFTQNYPWSKNVENQLIQRVIQSAKKGTRFTDPSNENISLSNYTITYLYRKKDNKVIRGWHGIQRDAFYLPVVLLENTHTNGTWIQNNDSTWKRGLFSLKGTLRKLKQKYKKSHQSQNYTLYESSVIHH